MATKLSALRANWEAKQAQYDCLLVKLFGPGTLTNASMVAFLDGQNLSLEIEQARANEMDAWSRYVRLTTGSTKSTAQ